jgi:calcineurin-like phosphoesterase family protein
VLLITSDLHFTDRVRDSYRWSIFDTLEDLADSDTVLLVLGDITDNKDGHSAALVNRILEEFADLNVREVHLLQGNHDYVDGKQAYFSFLEGTDYSQRVFWHSGPMYLFDGEVLLLPHTREPREDWEHLDLDGVKFIGCHQTFDGANAGPRKLASSVGPKYFRSKHKYEGLVVSGDIHLPQALGDVIYVGAPYPTSFGDSYQPRVLMIDASYKVKSIDISSIARWNLVVDSLESLKEFDILSGDQVKLKIKVSRAEFHNWSSIRDMYVAWAASTGVELFSVEMVERKSVVDTSKTFETKGKTNEEVLREFGRGLEPEVLATGVELWRGLDDGAF